jgi:hypothetical protein
VQREPELVEPEIVQPEIVYPDEPRPKPKPKPRQQRQTTKRKTLVQKKDLRQQSVDEHVRSHIDSSDIAYHADHLGDDVRSIDDKVAARLKRRFSHDVSQLDDLPSVQDDVVATVTSEDVSRIAQELVNMLRSPKNVRQAIMISEILKRPSFDD